MGGGAAMRSAAKAAGLGLTNSGLRRGFTVVPPAEQNVPNVSRPVSAILSSQGDKGSVDTGSVQRPSWELEDWEFAGGEEDLAMGTVVDPEPMARVVFGGAPSMSEAKEATDELKDALEKVYLSSANAPRCDDSVEVGRDRRVSVPLLTKSGCVENESGMVSGTKSVPKHAVQAFKMLSESPAAQSVVTSLACDPNVWNAVLRNEALADFLQSQKSCKKFVTVSIFVPFYSLYLLHLFSQLAVAGFFPVWIFNPKKHGTGTVSQYQVCPMKFEELSYNTIHDSYNGSQGGNTALSSNAIHESDNASQTEDSGTGFEDMIQNIKHTVVDMVNNVSVFFHNIFGSPPAENPSANADSKSSSIDMTLGASLMGLAMMVIMLVLVKRA